MYYRKRREFKFLLMVVLGVLSLAVYPISANDKVLYRYDGISTYDDDGLQLSNFKIIGPSPWKAGDTVTVEFDLKNTTRKPIYFGKRGIFAGCLNPNGGKEDFGHQFKKKSLLKGKTVHFKAVKKLDKKGTWTFWPSYYLGATRWLNHRSGYGLYKWQAAIIKPSTKPVVKFKTAKKKVDKPGPAPFVSRDSYHRKVEETYELAAPVKKKYKIVAPSVEAYAPNRRGDTKSLQFKLPHSSRIETLTYEVIDGLAIFEGDMILGTVSKVADQFLPLPELGDITTESSSLGTSRHALIVRAGRQYLWPYGIIPFNIDPAFSQPMRNRINAAIAMIETNTNLRLQQLRGEEHYVRFRMRANGCSSWVGRQGGRQSINISAGCGTGSIAHEILHAAGMWHEHSRNDRDAFVRILWENIDEKNHNFKKHDADGTDVGSYDYGSIMHYPSTAFGKTDPATGIRLTTIETTNPAVIGQRANLSAGDIAGVNSIYPLTVGFQGGEPWGKSNYATAIAFGDVDGDGMDEVGVARKSGVYARYWIFDDAVHNYRVLLSGGNDWGSSNYATDIAFGDVDNDGRDEVGITRKAGSNYRYIILDDAAAGFRTLETGGKKWGSKNYATGIAFGDVDNDGRDEVGITRKASSNYRYMILDLRNGQFSSLHTGGHGSGSSNYATSIAFGDVDGDGLDEVGITRKAGENMRYMILDDFNHQFREILNRGAGWGSSNYATSIAFGDVDGDGRDEVGIARRAGVNNRYLILNDANEYFQTIEAGGRQWGSSNFATGIAFGNVDGDNDADVGITRNSRSNMRYIILEMNL